MTTENRTDGPARIARDATPLLYALLDEWQTLFDLLWHGDAAPKSGSDERMEIINRQVDLFGTVYMLAALRQVDPVRANRAATFLAEMWDAGDSLGEWIYQWREELSAGKPLTLFLDQNAAETPA